MSHGHPPPYLGRKPRAVEIAIAESSKAFLQWDGDHLKWKEFLSHWDIYYSSIAHTLAPEAREDAILFANFLPDPWKPIMHSNIWNEQWSLTDVREFMDNQISQYIPTHLHKTEWDDYPNGSESDRLHPLVPRMDQKRTPE